MQKTDSKIMRSIEELEEAIRKKIKESGIPVRKIAKETEIGHSHINQFKLGISNISYKKLFKLANYFGIRYCLKNY